MSDLLVQEFDENIKDFNLPNLITKVSENWAEPHRKQGGLKILNALKNSEDFYKELLKKAHPFAEAWAVCKPFTVTFSFAEFAECNIKKGDIFALQNCIEKITATINEEADKTSLYKSQIQAIQYDYKPDDIIVLFYFQYFF